MNEDEAEEEVAKSVSGHARAANSEGGWLLVGAIGIDFKLCSPNYSNPAQCVTCGSQWFFFSGCGSIPFDQQFHLLDGAF
jgi:hypothetical protein